MTTGLLLLLRAAAVPAFARAGGGHSFSSGHGSGGHSYGGGSGVYASGDGVDFVSLWIAFVIQHPFVGVPMTLLVAYCVYQCYGGFSDYRESGTISRGLQAQSDADLAAQTAALKARDPNFDAPDLLKRVEAAFIAVQQAWTSMDMKRARAFVSDGVMERFTLQLAMLKDAGLRNEITDVTITASELLQLESSAHWDVVHVRLAATAVDRDRSLEDGGIVRGSGEPEAFEEVWTFARRPSARTLAGRGALEGSCPNCGATLQLVDGEQCEACKSWLNSGEFDWVLCEITQASEWGPRATRDVPGFAALEAVDAALNMRFLEDRASVAFWRLQEAMWRGDAASLRAVAGDGFCASLEAGEWGGYYFRDTAVGAVIALAAERGPGRDRVHLVVRWSGCRCERGRRSGEGKHYIETVFVLERDAGVQTDPRAGLRSLRCASCGAPPSSREAAACAYCGRAFNDGSRGWVLAQTMPASRWSAPAPSTAGAAEAAAAAPDDYGWTGSISPDAALRVMLATMAADGEIAPAEQAYLQAFARRRQISDESSAALIAAAREGRIDMPRPASMDEACSFLRGVVLMSLADGKITKEERRAIDACAQALDLKPADVDDLIARERRKAYEQAKRALAGRPAAA